MVIVIVGYTFIQGYGPRWVGQLRIFRKILMLEDFFFKGLRFSSFKVAGFKFKALGF